MHAQRHLSPKRAVPNDVNFVEYVHDVGKSPGSYGSKLRLPMSRRVISSEEIALENNQP